MWPGVCYVLLHVGRVRVPLGEVYPCLWSCGCLSPCCCRGPWKHASLDLKVQPLEVPPSSAGPANSILSVAPQVFVEGLLGCGLWANEARK